ncbi:transposase [Paenibacillus popilliae]|uniref:transposase n=1 Tax=Paenibacillus popilliae TaxID=78057 RepID=UPI003F556046
MTNHKRAWDDLHSCNIGAGTGDLRQYAHGRQLLRKAGLNLAECMSGKRKGRIVLSKRGDSTLRKYLYLATIQLVGSNPVFRKLHEHNVQIKRMKKQQSIFKLLGKLARILVGLIQRGENSRLKKQFATGHKWHKTNHKQSRMLTRSQDFKKKARRTEFVSQKGSDPSAKRYRSPHFGQVFRAVELSGGNIPEYSSVPACSIASSSALPAYFP